MQRLNKLRRDVLVGNGFIEVTMEREATLRVRASELTIEANKTEDLSRRERLLTMASHYVTMAENENWLVANSMSVARHGGN